MYLLETIFCSFKLVKNTPRWGKRTWPTENRSPCDLCSGSLCQELCLTTFSEGGAVTGRTDIFYISLCWLLLQIGANEKPLGRKMSQFHEIATASPSVFFIFISTLALLTRIRQYLCSPKWNSGVSRTWSLVGRGTCHCTIGTISKHGKACIPSCSPSHLCPTWSPASSVLFPVVYNRLCLRSHEWIHLDRLLCVLFNFSLNVLATEFCTHCSEIKRTLISLRSPFRHNFFHNEWA